MLIRLETDIPTHLERAAQYEEKMKKDADARRTDRGMRSDEAGPDLAPATGDDLPAR